MRHPLARPAAAAFALALAACSNSGSDGGDLRVVTQNMDEGTGYERLAAAGSPADFVAAVTATFNDIEATKPAERAKRIADEIADRSPDLVGLQEASMVRTGPAPASTVVSDLLQSLLDELSARGMHYRVVTVADRLDAEAPSLSGADVRLTTRDAILARDDASLQISNVRGGKFTAALQVPTAIGAIPIPRGWLAADVRTDRGSFTFVTTHLDTVAQVGAAQMTELTQILSANALPVVLAGDFNSVADVPSDPTHPTHDMAMAAGYQDAWLNAHSGDPGFTCCQSPFLTNFESVLSQRIDWILLKGVGVASIERVGDDRRDVTPSGLWPSDHAGLSANLRLGS